MPVIKANIFTGEVRVIKSGYPVMVVQKIMIKL